MGDAFNITGDTQAERCDKVASYVNTKMVKAIVLKIPKGEDVVTTESIYIPKNVVDKVATLENVERITQEEEGLYISLGEEGMKRFNDQLSSVAKGIFVFCAYNHFGMSFAKYLIDKNILDTKLQNSPLRVGDIPGVEPVPGIFYVEMTKLKGSQKMFFPHVLMTGFHTTLSMAKSIPFTKFDHGGVERPDGTEHLNQYLISIHPDHLVAAPDQPAVTKFDYRMVEFPMGEAEAEFHKIFYDRQKFSFSIDRTFFLCLEDQTTWVPVTET